MNGQIQAGREPVGASAPKAAIGLLQRSALVAGLSLVLTACGGAGSAPVASAPVPPPAPTPAASPPPAPTHTPAPPPFQPEVAKIFAEPLYNSSLAVMGKGWQFDYVPNVSGTRNVRDADNFTASYDQATGSYLVSVPVAGSGTIMQTGANETYPYGASNVSGFPADPSNKNSTNYCCNALSISTADRPQSQYRYVSFVDFYAPGAAESNLDTLAYGTFAVAQPTRPGEVPTTGSARYTGDLFGHFAGDAGATWLQGNARFDFDFLRGSLSGELSAEMRCMMGCNYGAGVVYAFADTSFARGATTFSGRLTTPGAPATGSFSGQFAGPGAVELMSQFRMPYFNPEYQRWMDAGGAIAAKRD